MNSSKEKQKLKAVCPEIGEVIECPLEQKFENGKCVQCICLNKDCKPYEDEPADLQAWSRSKNF